MRILTDSGYIGINHDLSHGLVTVLVSDDEGCAVLSFDVEQCNSVIAALIEARNAVTLYQNRGNNDPD